MFKWALNIILLMFSFGVSAQDSLYFVHFDSKIGTPFSINAPHEFLSERSLLRRAKQGIEITTKDLPVNPTYLDSLTAYGISVIYSSKWLNGALLSASPSERDLLLTFPFVTHIAFGKALRASSGISGARVKSSKFASELQILDYGSSLAQMDLMGAVDMHAHGYHGEGMLIAIMDNGFLNSHTIACLDTLFDGEGVLEVYDFVDNDSTVFAQGGHGTNVLSCMAAFTNGALISPAYKASYVLYRTEDDFSETHAEEVFWLIAAERADSLGVDVINTSLGYSTFDNPADNYTTAQMDGNTAFITKAADLAASTGMLVVNSAGNEGNTTWHIITAPADADSVLTVGALAVDSLIASFSSRGPTSDGRIKPDLMAVGSQTYLCTTNGTVSFSYGTSFSSPLLAAMAACTWQANPYLTAQELKKVLIASGHLFDTPNMNYGYGIPNWYRADSLAKTAIGPLALLPHQEIDYLEILPVSPSQLHIKFDDSLIGDTIKVQVFDISLGENLLIETFTLTDVLKIVSLPLNSFLNNLLVRIEDLSQLKTLALYKF